MFSLMIDYWDALSHVGFFIYYLNLRNINTCFVCLVISVLAMNFCSSKIEILICAGVKNLVGKYRVIEIL